MVVKITNKVIVDNDEEFEATDIPDAIKQWQEIHSGVNTIPTSQITSAVVVVV